LRDRREDILSLVTRLWQDVEKEYGRPGPALEAGAILRLREASWPGNARQRRSTVKRLFVLAPGERPDADSVSAVLEPIMPVQSSPSNAMFADSGFRNARKLRENSGSISRTAEAVGLAHKLLQEKVKEPGIVSAPDNGRTAPHS
jgi:DNA-binding NtrC family response regulator